MKRKIGLYTPYLDTLGGGEKYILSILQLLEGKENEICVFWDKDLSQEIRERFNLTFKNMTFVPNIFKENNSFMKKITTLNSFDMLFYVTDGSYFFSNARKNYIYAMVPDGDLYKRTPLNNIKLINFKFITHSKFTQNQLKKLGIYAHVILPYLDQNYLNFDVKSMAKEKIILSVGRFFKHLHTKKQDIIIKTFKDMKIKTPALANFKLVMAGGLKSEDKNYLAALKKIARNDPSIIFKPNISYDELLALYQKSFIYWHFTGYGIDEDKHPELVEHLGITPLEAMASGCITCCYKAGGPKEIVKDGVNGFLFNSGTELRQKTSLIIKNYKLQNKIVVNANNYVKENFSFPVFEKRVREVITI